MGALVVLKLLLRFEVLELLSFPPVCLSMVSYIRRLLAVLNALLVLLVSTRASAVIHYRHDLREEALVAHSIVRVRVTKRAPVGEYEERLWLTVVKTYAGTHAPGSSFEAVAYRASPQERLPHAVDDDAERIVFVRTYESDNDNHLAPFRVVSTDERVNLAAEQDVVAAIDRAKRIRAELAKDQVSSGEEEALLALVVDPKGFDRAWNEVPPMEMGVPAFYQDAIAGRVIDLFVKHHRLEGALRVLERSPAMAPRDTSLTYQSIELLHYAREHSRPLKLRLRAIEVASDVVSPEPEPLTLLGDLLQDPNEEMRAGAIRTLERWASWRPSSPRAPTAARLAESLWRTEQAPRVRLEILRSKAIREVATLSDDRRVYSEAHMMPRGWLHLSWGSVNANRAVRVRELLLRDRTSNQVLQVLRSKEDKRSDDGNMFEGQVLLRDITKGTTVDLVAEGSVESATHDTTSFAHPLGTQTVTDALLRNDMETGMWGPLDDSSDAGARSASTGSPRVATSEEHAKETAVSTKSDTTGSVVKLIGALALAGIAAAIAKALQKAGRR
jgi:hypothetical protein